MPARGIVESKLFACYVSVRRGKPVVTDRAPSARNEQLDPPVIVVVVPAAHVYDFVNFPNYSTETIGTKNVRNQNN